MLVRSPTLTNSDSSVTITGSSPDSRSARALDRRTALLAVDRAGDRGDVRRGGAAAAAHDVEEAGVAELRHDRGRLLGGLVVLTEGVPGQERPEIAAGDGQVPPVGGPPRDWPRPACRGSPRPREGGDRVLLVADLVGEVAQVEAGLRQAGQGFGAASPRSAWRRSRRRGRRPAAPSAAACAGRRAPGSFFNSGSSATASRNRFTASIAIRSRSWARACCTWPPSRP